MNYQEYLNSPLWRIRRELKLKSQPVCQKCSFPYELNVHHTTYVRLGHEEDEDLIVLCRTCHSRHHFVEHVQSSEILQALVGDSSKIEKSVDERIREARTKNIDRQKEVQRNREEYGDDE